MKKKTKTTRHVSPASDLDAELSLAEAAAGLGAKQPPLTVPSDAPFWIRDYIERRAWIPAPPPEPTREEALVRGDATELASTDPVGALTSFGGKPPAPPRPDLPTEHGVPASFAGVFGPSLDLTSRKSELKTMLTMVYGLLSVYFEPRHPKEMPESMVAGGIFGEDEIGFSYFEEPEPGGEVKTLLLAAAWSAREAGGPALFARAVKEAEARFLTKRRAQKKAKKKK